MRLVVAVLLGTLGRCRVYRTWSASSLRVASLGGEPVPLCLDGEATETSPRISLIKRPRKLLVYRPKTGDEPAKAPETGSSPNWRWQWLRAQRSAERAALGGLPAGRAAARG
jgi:hypothetical protein